MKDLCKADIKYNWGGKLSFYQITFLRRKLMRPWGKAKRWASFRPGQSPCCRTGPLSRRPCSLRAPGGGLGVGGLGGKAAEMVSGTFCIVAARRLTASHLRARRKHDAGAGWRVGWWAHLECRANGAGGDTEILQIAQACLAPSRACCLACHHPA